MTIPVQSAPNTAETLGPYLLFLGDIENAAYAKTAFGVRDWAPDRCVGEFALAEADVATGLPRIEPEEAYARGARALLIAVATPGGLIPAEWLPSLKRSLAAGLDIVSGMHVRLNEIDELVEAATRFDRKLIDLRIPPPDIPIATGQRRSGRRLLTVGTDCALGKKYTALAVAQELQGRGIDARFRATGQTGMMISGSGIPIDAVVADFVAGAAELLSPAGAADHLDVIEGQGSLFHPAYAAVSLGLLHGSQPDMFIVCHQPGRTHVLGYPEFQLPSVDQVISQTISLGKLTNPAVRCVGLSLNTAHLDEKEASELLRSESDRLSLAVADPMRGGPAFERLLDACEA